MPAGGEDQGESLEDTGVVTAGLARVFYTDVNGDTVNSKTTPW